MKKIRYILWGTVAIMLAVYIGLFVWRGTGNPVFEASSQSESNAFSPSFMLVDHQGNTVTEKTYRGQWLLVFFGFTNCPDICPTTLSDLAVVIDQIGGKAASVTPLFISVDPERDRVESMAEYVSAFHPTIVGLTGAEKQIASAVETFKAYYEKQQPDRDQSNYAVAHTSAVYLISPDGTFVRTFGYGTATEVFVTELNKRL
ncbi:MAG: electron transport protein SCO1/SenC [Rhodospirillales bacterium]|nr:electron transport protein SCO1/SenC [Rhodospirillales bacterium]MAY54905.1 electron transport protein SCO1/SenC [Gammaproteobacteria bacterium]